MSMSRFEGKHVVVLGSGFALAGPEDIGRASAVAFASEGAEVAIAEYTRSIADECVNEIRTAGGVASAHVADWRDPRSYERLATTIGSDWPLIDVLVTHHFASCVKSVQDTSLEEWEETIRVNLTGVFMAVKAFLPMLKRSKSGSIVNVGSIDGEFGNPNIPAYSASKAGVHVLTHVLAAELAKDNIRVNCVSRAASTALPLTGNVLQQVAGATPLARAGTPNEYAGAVLFLASDQASYITGAILPVDGGRTAVTPGCSPGYKSYLS